MAGLVRNSRRVPYEKLRERLWESQLPWDDQAERWAIGAVLLAPNEWARKFSGKLYSGHFYDVAHGWLWEELGSELIKRKNPLDKAGHFEAWFRDQRIQRRFREQFMGNVGREIAACTRDCFWWHGRWYIDRVLATAKVREPVIRNAKLLAESLDRAESWRGR